MFARSICYILLVPFTLFDPVILIVAMAKKVWNALIFPSKRLYIQYKVKFQPRRFKSPRKLFLYFLEEPLQLWWCCLKLVLWDSLPRETRSRMADPPVGVGDPLEWAGGLRHTPWHYLSCPLLQGMQNWNWLKQLWLTTQSLSGKRWKEDHQLLLMQKLALASFLPEISPHVRCHVGFSLMISSFYSLWMTDAASVDVKCDEVIVPR